MYYRMEASFRARKEKKSINGRGSSTISLSGSATLRHRMRKQLSGCLPVQAISSPAINAAAERICMFSNMSGGPRDCREGEEWGLYAAPQSALQQSRQAASMSTNRQHPPRRKSWGNREQALQPTVTASLPRCDPLRETVRWPAPTLRCAIPASSPVRARPMRGEAVRGCEHR